jgi:hypothetical protein
MQAFRLLVRASPFLLGALAAAIWLRRGTIERPQLMPPKAAEPAAEDARSEPATPPPADREHAPTGRFAREPIDIVTVVDDLLVPGSL